jgi:protein involved in ribonucleotide reduction
LFSGPTLFTPIISTVSAITESSGSQQKYSILLMMTDGAINDMEGTIRTLIKASGLPLSVVIIGVGNENFGEMKRLDSDSGLLSLGAEKAQRDIVQFVAFRDTVAQGTSVLAQEVLAEIPNQVVDFMEKHSIVPNIRKA